MNSKKTWIAASILMVTMLLGIAIGSAGTLLILKSAFRSRGPIPNHEMDKRREPIKDFMLRRMDRSLELSDEQRVAVKLELDSVSEAFNQLHEKTGKEVEAIASSSDENIRKILNEKQRKKYEEEFVKRRKFGPMRDRDRRFGEGPGDFKGPPRMPPGGDLVPPPDEMMRPPPPQAQDPKK